MPRRSKRLKSKRMSDSEEDHNKSEGDITIVKQDAVADLREEIRTLKDALNLLLSRDIATQAIKDVTVNLPDQSNTQQPQDSLPTTYHGTTVEQKNDVISFEQQPGQQGLSTSSFSLPSSNQQNLYMPYYSFSYMPTPVPTSSQVAVSHTEPLKYMPQSSLAMPTSMPLQTIASSFMPRTILQPNTYVPSTSYMTPPPIPSSSISQPLHSTSTANPYFMNTNATSTMPQNFYEHRPMRKLHDLPEFDGQPEKWPMFAASFKETSLCYNYTKLENLTRLQKALKGDARKKVEAYLIHAEGIEQVMKTLEFHYGRPQTIIRSQISKVRAFPAISGKRLSDIVNLSTMVANLIVFLENAGATPHLANPTLLDELVNKLPFSKREEWMKYSLHHLTQYPSIRDFSIWLQDVATYISLATEADFSKDETASNKKEKLKTSFAITTNDRRQVVCLLCQQNHPLFQCIKFKKLSTTERWQFVKEKHLCFCCLYGGHNTSNCKNRRQCNLSKCTKFHNRLLHEESKYNNQNANFVKCLEPNVTISDGNEISDVNIGKNENLIGTIVDDIHNKKTLFKYLPVKLMGPKGSAEVIAFIDDGSKISLLEESVATLIGIKGPTSKLSLGWIGGKTSNEISRKVNFEICTINSHGNTLAMKNVRTTKNLQLPQQSLDLKKFEKVFPELGHIKIDDYYEAVPQLLIGLPHIGLVRPYGVVNLDENFSIHRTKLGNILFGSNEESTEAVVCVIDVDGLDDIQQQVEQYFTLESFGTKSFNSVTSDADKRAEKILEETTMKVGMHYETGLLWTKDEICFKESFAMALKRLEGVERKLKKDENLAKWYSEKINEYIAKGYARKLSPEEVSVQDDRTWYLPHFAVANINKGNKRRLVFDAAASVNGESLNSMLLKGPSKYQPKPLLAILFRFRQFKIGVCADIEEMFHRITIREQDQNAQRFLWRDSNSTRAPDTYVMRAMIFGSASSPCSAQYIKNLNAKLYEEISPRATKAIIDCHYVDDYVDSFSDVGEAITVTKDVIDIHKQANFKLRCFVSNSVEFRNAINFGESRDDEMNMTSLCRSETATEKILGLFWVPMEDAFCFLLKFNRVSEAVAKGERKPTKREVLSITMSIFDPFGFLADMVIRSKILLQELWRCDIDWNAQIPQSVYEKWYEWYRELRNVQYIKVPRCYDLNFGDATTVIDLHIFVDASEVAFAAVGYWRMYFAGQVKIIFVAGKSKCAPLKPLSIPRLELQAAVLGTRLKEAIIVGHDIKPQNVIFWSDSKTVIKWIYSDSRIYKQFVSHRVCEILENSLMSQWRWVPGSQNPADDATRPKHFSGDSYSRWLNGPQFLESDETNWPSLPKDVKQEEHDCEVRSKFVSTIIDKNVLIPYDENSKYYTLLRIRCWVARAVNTFKCVGSRRKGVVSRYHAYLTSQEIEEAEIYWCQIAQQEEFAREYAALKLGIPVSDKSPIYKFSPILGHDGLIRVSGRINKANCVTQVTKEPIIMPKNHVITKLIVSQFHNDFRHQNQESICAAVRTKFWVPCLRQLVKWAKRKCQICKNKSAVPSPPMMGQHPVDRLSPYVRPFSYTGLDYIGPYTVSIGRRSEKRWVALFTCLTVRAVHLEIARDLSADAAILCIRNFINRRGVPVRIRSDRGTNFMAASKEKFVINNVKLANECTRRGVEWLFNTPANPSAGGSWERMVRSIKNVLAYTLKEKSPQIETFNSLLLEAENLVNSRPLTHLPVETSACEPLTPNHFLLGCPNIVQTPAVGEKVFLRKQWHILQHMKQTFWKRWVLEYLPDLTRRTKWYKAAKPIKVGDVVIICDDNETRGEWKKGIVEEVTTADDGQVRSALVRTVIGKLRRPASKLAILDVKSETP